jgi:hypothetical protein
MCLIDKGLVGGPGEDRTPDPMVANHVLSQLSYRPTQFNILTGNPLFVKTIGVDIES